MDPTQVAIRDLEAMEAQQGAICSATSAQHRTCPRGTNRRQSPWPLALGQQPGLAVSTSDCLLRFVRSSSVAGLRSSSTELNRRMRTRMYGGVAGESGRPLPLCRLRVWENVWVGSGALESHLTKTMANHRVVLWAVDLQTDFMHPEGKLYV